MKRFRNLSPRRRRQLVALLGVLILIVIYRRSRAAQTPPPDDVATGETEPTAPFWPDAANPLDASDAFGLGLSGGGLPASPAVPSTGTPSSKPRRDARWRRQHGYAAWLRAHPKATLAERIKALERLIGQGRGNLRTELAELTKLRARRRRRAAAGGKPSSGPRTPIVSRGGVRLEVDDHGRLILIRDGHRRVITGTVPTAGPFGGKIPVAAPRPLGASGVAQPRSGVARSSGAQRRPARARRAAVGVSLRARRSR